MKFSAVASSPFVAFLHLLGSFSAATIQNQRTLKNITKWAQLGNDIDGRAAEDWFGYDVSMSGDERTFAAGGPGNPSLTHEGNEDEKSDPSPEYVQVLEYSNGSWN